MDMVRDDVTVINTENAAAATALLTLAFADDPVTRWMYPTPQQQLTGFPALVRAFAQAAFDHGSGRGLGGIAAALWLPPGLHPDEEAFGAVISHDLPAEIREEAMAYFAGADAHHPHQPHWYLPLIGVDPAHQGTGYGSALLREGLKRVDRDHLPAYLESTNLQNIPLYERHGFVVLGEVSGTSAPPLTPMLRAAR